MLSDLTAGWDALVSSFVQPAIVRAAAARMKRIAFFIVIKF